jgi:hypothetical protein
MIMVLSRGWSRVVVLAAVVWATCVFGYIAKEAYDMNPNCQVTVKDLSDFGRMGMDCDATFWWWSSHLYQHGTSLFTRDYLGPPNDVLMPHFWLMVLAVLFPLGIAWALIEVLAWVKRGFATGS